MSETYQKILSAISHVIYLTGFGFFWIPLVCVFIGNSTQSEFLEKQAKQAMVAQGILGILSIITCVLCYLLVGFLLLPILGILLFCYFFLSLFAAYKALIGEDYQYPLVGKIAERI